MKTGLQEDKSKRIMMDASVDPTLDGWVQADNLDDFTELVGPLWTRGDGEVGRYAFVAQQKHINRYGGVHGGMLLTFADKSFGLTAWEATGRRHLATIQLDMHFLNKVERGSLVTSRCDVTRKASSVVFIKGGLMVRETLVATASGVWKYR